MKKYLKLFVVILIVSCALNACTPRGTPTPETIEVTRIVEQTVEVLQTVEQTVVVTELVEVTPIPVSAIHPKFDMTEDHFDAMLALYKHYSYLANSQCEEYYFSFTEEKQMKMNKEEMLSICENRIEKVNVISIVPTNYDLAKDSKLLYDEPTNTIYFKALVDKEERLSNEDTTTINHRQYLYHIEVIFENGEWKIGEGGTSSFPYNR